MNLSKTEKLIVARKKLKEFQQSKKIHMQDDLSKDRNGVAKLLLQNEIQETSSHKCQSQSDHNIPTNDSSQDCKISVDNNDSHVNTQTINTTCINDKIIAKKIDIANDLKQVVGIELTNTVLSSEKDNIANHMQQTIDESSENNSDHLPINEMDKNQNDQYLYEQPKKLSQAAINEFNENTDNNRHKNADSDLHYQSQGYMQDQNQVVNQSQIQVRQYSSKIAELQAALAAEDAEIEIKLLQETKQLKEQLQMHMQTTSILISEKADLIATLDHNQTTIKHNAEEIEELSGKLKCSQVRVSELEKELNTVRKDSEEAYKTIQLMKEDHETLYEKYSELKKEKEDLALQVSELKQKLNVKNTELTSLQQSLQEKSALLSLSELKIQQLTSTSQELGKLEDQHDNVTMLEQQIAQMKETLKAVSEENDEASRQYQNYGRLLEAQQEALLHEFEHQKQLNTELEIRERSYIERLSNLEQQLQSEKEKVQDLFPLQNQKQHIDSLMKEIDELTLEQERLHIIISEKETDIEMLSKTIQELQNKESVNTDALKLAQALESEQLGASRAVSQNQQLKQQLNEMHDAFISLSNAKLDLTEQLQSERTIGRKLNAELNKVEAEVEYLKKCLKEKELIMIEQEKNDSHNSSVTDQTVSNEAQTNYIHTLQQELQNSLATIDDLKIENEKLLQELNHTRVEKEERVNELNSVNNEVSQNTNQNITDNMDDAAEVKIVSHSTTTDSSDFSEHTKKLEQRFKETMEKLAELTDEKQRLEHLVLQLQSETETIGEYIALYQQQRAILQDKAKQKDEIFRQLVEQKNEQQEQLHKLKVLVTVLIKGKSSMTDSAKPCSSNCEGKNEKDSTFTNNNPNHNVVAELPDDKTKSEILDLLTEIKDCKDSCIFTSNYHPCPACSGKLITV